MTEQSNVPPEGIPLYGSAEDAALAGWIATPRANARVIAVEPGDLPGSVRVTVQTDGNPGFHDRDISSCLQAPDGRWWETGSVGA